MQSIAQINKHFDIEGHRGCRGLMPENTIPAFIKAVQIGVTTLEMDVVITKDKKVIVSHEPWMNAGICTDATGNTISKNDEKSLNIYNMTYEEVKTYDCGTKPYARFPKQYKMKVSKPLLANVIDSVESYSRANNVKPPFYNIETKCTPDGDSIFHPAPAEFTELLLDVIFKKGVAARCIIQSFDVRTLQYAHKKYPTLKLALLVEDSTNYQKNIHDLGFTPYIYSPNQEIVNAELVSYCRAQKMKLVVWTVNEKEQMDKLVHLGVDGIITDYPDVAVSHLLKPQLELIKH